MVVVLVVVVVAVVLVTMLVSVELLLLLLGTDVRLKASRKPRNNIKTAIIKQIILSIPDG